MIDTERFRRGRKGRPAASTAKQRFMLRCLYSGKRLRRIVAGRSDDGYGYQCAKPLCGIRKQGKLYLQALTLYAGEIGVEIWSALDETPDVRAAFERFLLATINAYCQESVPRGCMIALDALHRTQSSDKVCNVLRNRRQTNIEILKKRLERGIRDGDIPASVNCEAVATFTQQSRTACPFSRAMAERAKTSPQRHWAPWPVGRNWFSQRIIRPPALTSEHHQDNPPPAMLLRRSR